MDRDLKAEFYRMIDSQGWSHETVVGMVADFLEDEQEPCALLAHLRGRLPHDCWAHTGDELAPGGHVLCRKCGSTMDLTSESNFCGRPIGNGWAWEYPGYLEWFDEELGVSYKCGPLAGSGDIDPGDVVVVQIEHEPEGLLERMLCEDRDDLDFVWCCEPGRNRRELERILLDTAEQVRREIRGRGEGGVA